MKGNQCRLNIEAVSAVGSSHCVVIKSRQCVGASPSEQECVFVSVCAFVSVCFCESVCRYVCYKHIRGVLGGQPVEDNHPQQDEVFIYSTHTLASIAYYCLSKFIIRANCS